MSTRRPRSFDNIDLPAATKLGILVTNTPDVLTETTAEFAFALMIAAAHVAENPLNSAASVGRSIG